MNLNGVPSLEGEEWRPVAGWEHEYLVSNLGRVYSIPRKARYRPCHGGLLTLRNRGFYISVMLCRAGSKQVRVRIHRLVATAFCENPQGHPLVRHLNGNADDNRAVNLAWGTASENIWDLVAHGTHTNANKTHCAQGHEFTEANTYRRKRGGRMCKTCHAAWRAAYNERRREAS